MPKLGESEGEVPTGLVRVLGGNLPADSWDGAQSVFAFYIGKYEVQWGEWQSVRRLGLAQGYAIGAGAGRGEEFPVTDINWYDALKWCNARSEQEGLDPVYTVSGAVYKTGEVVPTASLRAKGCRLPREKEWCFDVYSGTVRSFRGGSAAHYESSCRLALRKGYFSPGYESASLGFRVLRNFAP